MPSDYSIFGAGLTGLAAGYHLQKKKISFSLYEKNAYPGGVIQTIQTPYGISEKAAHSFLLSPEVADILHDIGVLWQRPKNHARWIYRNGKPHQFPLTFLETLHLIYKMIFTISTPQKKAQYLTSKRWSDIFFSKSFDEYLLSPFLTGIFAASSTQVQLSFAFPSLMIPYGMSPLAYLLRAQLRRYRLPAAHKGMVAPLWGMQSLTDALASRVEPHITYSADWKDVAITSLEHQHVVLAMSAQENAAFIRQNLPQHLMISEALESIAWTPLVSMTVYLPQELSYLIPQGIGCLFPAQEQRKILGILFNSFCFEHRAIPEWESFTVMLGGVDSLDASDATLMKIVQSEFCDIFKSSVFASALVFCPEAIHRWPQAIPCYDWKTARAVQYIKDNTPSHLTILGNYMGTIGIRQLLTVANGIG